MKFAFKISFASDISAEKCPSTDTQVPFPLTDASGTTIKNLCIVLLGMTQSDANTYCTAGYMVLFQINNAATQTALFTFLDQIFSASGYSFAFRVDGLRDTTDKNWYYFSYGKAPAFSGLSWYMGSDTLDGLNSLVATNMAYPVQKALPSTLADGVSSSETLPVLCEY